MYIHKGDLQLYPKILVSKITIDKIKQTVCSHLDINNFNSNEINNNKRNVVRFFIESSKVSFLTPKSNTMESNFKGLSNNNDVSKSYDSLITYLKKEYKIFKDWE